MKIIGISESGYDVEYVCTVRHSEIAAVFDKYRGDFNAPKVGDVVNLAAGYVFRDDIKRSCEAMTEAMKKFDGARTSMTKFAVMVAQLPEPAAEES